MLSLIVAMGENRVIGANNRLPWHLPRDLQRFKQLTTGHHIIMGRKTFESIGRVLPNRVSIIVTTQKNYQVSGAVVVGSLEQAIELAQRNDQEPFIIGGAQLFAAALPQVGRIYLTQIHHAFTGDTFFPILSAANWQEIERQDFEPDEKNPYFYAFSTQQRIV